jgi:hypothetical protein
MRGESGLIAQPRILPSLLFGLERERQGKGRTDVLALLGRETSEL